MELPTISHPTDRPNFTEVRLGEITVWFSYSTPVAFVAPGWGRTVRENVWGPTTGKHLNYVDNGDKSSRVSSEAFQTRLEDALAGLGPAQAVEPDWCAIRERYDWTPGVEEPEIHKAPMGHGFATLGDVLANWAKCPSVPS